jgi:hypothetical protein
LNEKQVSHESRIMVGQNYLTKFLSGWVPICINRPHL